MNKHIETKFDETFYTETLKNGLKVILWHKPLMKTTACVFATPYGSLDFEETDENGKTYHHPSGIAHFLEHKMFEKEGEDVMNEFSKMGANVNAFTSYNETMYYFSTTSEDLEKPLNLLLDFVQELNITEESVEKEKGIITQELMMYMQMPDSRLYFETFKAMYHHHPLKYDIGGSPESVANTTKEQMEECFKINYHPSRMVLICAGPVAPEKMMEWIQENQEKKEFESFIPVHRTPFEEEETVVEEARVIPMEVSSTKVALGYKLKPWAKDDAERVGQEWAIRIALEAHFSSINPDYQKWIDEEIINDYFDYEIDLQRDAALILFINETEDREGFKQFILKEMEICLKKTVGFETLNQLKKRYYGQAMRVLNSSEDIAIGAARNHLNGVSLFETLAMLEKMDQSKVEEALSHVSLKNVCEVAIVPQTRNEE